MSTLNETHTFKKTTQPKTIRIPLLGNHDCYMDITITENHEALCNHIENNFESYPVVLNSSRVADDKMIVKISAKKVGEQGEEQVVEVSKTVHPNSVAESINASELLPKNDIAKLSDILNNIIRSNVKTVDGDFAEHSQCSCSIHECVCPNKLRALKPPEVKAASTPTEVEETRNNEIAKLNNLLMDVIQPKTPEVRAASAPIEVVEPRNNEIAKLNNLLTDVIQPKANKAAQESIGDVTQHTQCSCSSPECSCVSSKIASKHNSNLPKPISSLMTNKGSTESKRQRPHQVSDSKIQTVTNYDDFNNPHFINDEDLPLEGYNHNQQQLAKKLQQDEIDELAKEIYNPEEREKKLRLLRLLIQEAMPKNSVPIMSKTIEIPHSVGYDLHKTDSLIIRIIVEKEIKE